MCSAPKPKPIEPPAPAPAPPLPAPVEQAVGSARKAEEDATFGVGGPQFRRSKSTLGKGSKGGTGLKM